MCIRDRYQRRVRDQHPANMGCGASTQPTEDGDKKSVNQTKIDRIVDEFMDTDGDGEITQEECVKFHAFLSGEPDATVGSLPSDTKELIGMKSAKAKAKIKSMCDDEDKLDFIIKKYEEAKA
eukprot:TRINITY_DN1811_c0_g1_i4.p1 TRINITY_DN1811_c0_g1~~TRINITY_DN1811_c0_g1_i4.p1  ORF type:complete len:122 (+),score=43.61 TRINITY_DN1811_c0_g1_i4:143-508(+)